MHITRSDGSLCTLWTNRCVGRPAQRNMGERSISRSPHTTGARVRRGFLNVWPTQITVARAERRPSRRHRYRPPAAPPPEPPPSEPPPPPAATAGDAAAGDAAAQTAAAAPAGPGRRRQLRPKTAAEAERRHRLSRPMHTTAQAERRPTRCRHTPPPAASHRRHPPLPDPPLPHPRSERRRPSRRRSQRHRLSCRRRRPNCRRANDRRCPSRTPTDPLPPGLRARCVSLCPLSSRLHATSSLRACLQADAKCLSAKYGGM
jgi:hypothetical protein